MPGACRVNLGIDPHHDDACRATNSYVWQRQKAGFLTPAAAVAGGARPGLTRQVALNNRWAGAGRADEGDGDHGVPARSTSIT